MNKFTHGTWNIGDGIISSQRLAYGGKYNVLIASTENNSVSLSEGKANARLIAAAPDLLEALEDMLNGWKYIRESHGDLYGVGWDRAQDKAVSAIARARGEA